MSVDEANRKQVLSLIEETRNAKKLVESLTKMEITDGESHYLSLALEAISKALVVIEEVAAGFKNDI